MAPGTFGIGAGWLALAATLGGACASSAVPLPMSEDLGAARHVLPTATLAALTDGRRAFVGKCGGCHALPRPATREPEDWPRIVDEMRAAHAVGLTDREAAELVAYLAAVAARAR